MAVGQATLLLVLAAALHEIYEASRLVEASMVFESAMTGVATTDLQTKSWPDGSKNKTYPRNTYFHREMAGMEK